MSLKQWEKKTLETPGAKERVREIEDELRLAAGLTALRERAGVSQRELAERIGVSQPRVVAIERSRNVTIEVLEQYVEALGGHLEVSVVQGHQRTSLLGHEEPRRSSASTPAAKRSAAVRARASRGGA
jgi:transcriptional regulator with XRE-family HTH domain